ncbi:Arm DNA-binding domain-containing protein [Paraburkholderia sp. BL10I2N1]|uniref:Arm DNA-binding domain-containing protein n=1 Tax=Paraburkholderia sp. BL10I2N1 TaxID=1938796 RepID=UPI0032618C0A
MALSDIKIRQARVSWKPIKFTDSNGHYVEVKPNGSKRWRYRYELAGKENSFEPGLRTCRAVRRTGSCCGERDICLALI